jgi:hypothetical protein
MSVNNFYAANVRNGLVLLLDSCRKESYNRVGTSWNDISYVRSGGTLTNFSSPSPQTIWNGSDGSIIFDGTDDYVDLGINNNLLSFGTNPFTINLWINPTCANDGFNHTLLSNYNDINSGFSTYFFLAVYNSFGVLFLNPGGGFVNNLSTSISVPVSNNTWSNVCFTKDANTYTSYFNGTQIKTVTSVGLNWSGVGRASKIGGGVSGTISNYSGKLELLSIYNRALSTSEVLQNYNSFKGRFGL